MIFKFFILIPSLSPVGPVKGAIALANQLVTNYEVILVSIKRGSGASAYIDSRVKLVSLFEYGSTIFSKAKVYMSFLKHSEEGQIVVSLSMGFSADFINNFCKGLAFIVSSVRGNLPVNYKLDYGNKGLLLAYFHLFMLRRFDLVTAMTIEMSHQIGKFTKRKPEVIGNFIDEAALLPYLAAPKPLNKRISFVFVGSLTIRKCPLLLIDAIKTLVDRDYDVSLDMLGDGPLKNQVLSRVDTHGLSDVIRVHGQVENPFSEIRKATVFVLPSLSEGISRASIEALFLGTPVVVREVDGNHALIEKGFNGAIFKNDDELVDAMLMAVTLKANDKTQNFLPSNYRQATETNKFIHLMEFNNGRT
ncbi:glycosyltransferase [Litorivicinus sp.]|nr:glycosyltransferase [Litorivicinus sp.]